MEEMTVYPQGSETMPHPTHVDIAADHIFASTAPLGRIGQLEVRLARHPDEVAAAQAIRYRVFYDELGAAPSPDFARIGREYDRFDELCDHLLVIDTALGGRETDRIVGTYRLLLQACAEKAGGFYSEQEFALEKLIARNPQRRFLELGRSCVLPAYRSKRTIELLWQGIWAYCGHHNVDVMTGCASFSGTVPAAHAQALSFLSHYYKAEGRWAVRAHNARYSSMDLMPAEAIEMKVALSAMPPLIKGYIRLGAKFGEGCVVDNEFDTTDVLVVLPVEWISDRYIAYYGADQVVPQAAP